MSDDRDSKVYLLHRERDEMLRVLCRRKFEDHPGADAEALAIRHRGAPHTAHTRAVLVRLKRSGTAVLQRCRLCILDMGAAFIFERLP